MGPSGLGRPPLRSQLTANFAMVAMSWPGWKARRAVPVCASTVKTPAADRVGILRVDDPELVILVGGGRRQLLDREQAPAVRAGFHTAMARACDELPRSETSLAISRCERSCRSPDLPLQIGELAAGDDSFGFKLVLHALHFQLRQRGFLVQRDELGLLREIKLGEPCGGEREARRDRPRHPGRRRKGTGRAGLGGRDPSARDVRSSIMDVYIRVGRKPQDARDRLTAGRLQSTAEALRAASV